MSNASPSEGATASRESLDSAYGLGPDFSAVPPTAPLSHVSHFVAHGLGSLSELDRRGQVRTAVERDWREMSATMNDLERAHATYVSSAYALNDQYVNGFPAQGWGRESDVRSFHDRYERTLERLVSERTDEASHALRDVSWAAEKIIKTSRQPHANSVGVGSERTQAALTYVDATQYTANDGLLRQGSRFLANARAALALSAEGSRERTLVARSLLLSFAYAAGVDAELAAKEDKRRGDGRHTARDSARDAVDSFCGELGVSPAEAKAIAETVIDSTGMAARLGMLGHR